MNDRKNAVVIYSGGMDSLTLLHYVRTLGYDKVLALTFGYGQTHSDQELKAAKATCKGLDIEHEVVGLPALANLIGATSALTGGGEIPHGHYAASNMKVTVVPNRNMVMIALALSYAIANDASVVYYGAHRGDHTIYPDCRPEFARAMKVAAGLCDYEPLSVLAPFIAMSKGDILALGLSLETGAPDYSVSWTCYEGGSRPCGKCGACVERAEAFEALGIPDPLIGGSKRSRSGRRGQK